jgi:transposase-like protein
MSKISTEAKQAIIEKVLSKDGRTVREIAEAHNMVLSQKFS